MEPAAVREYKLWINSASAGVDLSFEPSAARLFLGCLAIFLRSGDLKRQRRLLRSSPLLRPIPAVRDRSVFLLRRSMSPESSIIFFEKFATETSL
ncbi:hypothetical protein MRB53_023855 [Persea americana]|uniref:Uncharacterized protein n=1 Tax=Persea americana TaxID=3435 RepID=A0ACC2LAX7_PERAE|nr:hypothetical protein MRB53_023855 [Persea americana]